ncbi:ABC transporter substrate-binding protein [Bradyrhizobium sp. Ec3.3]|uniref:ABC transporter substrate-binding protein n=1 Tax=Bradyrhizobium sp. Ec3.3 TaxID=189753 RepID=UPI0004105584|nr:ABC transporter substrate-binding protein [Bradyrhizobium sp. Ec3.3]
MRRREFIMGFCVGSVWWFAARAEAKTYRLGLLGNRPIGESEERRKAIKEVLAENGFAEGRNFQYEARWGDALAENVEALRAAKVDVIITFGYPAAFAAKTLATEVPIVCSGAGDPVATGLAQSLAHPGGNLTGVTEIATELSAKRLEILKEAIPNLKTVAMLFNAADLAMTLRSRATEAAAKVLDVGVQTFGVREPSDFGNAFAEMTRSPPDAILMVSDTLTMLNRKRVMEFAESNRLPAIYEFGFLVRDGGLMSYGPNLPETGRRVGDLVVRILRGARAADLPLEQPTHLEFVVNLKTAKNIGFNFPPALLSRADEVIE